MAPKGLYVSDFDVASDHPGARAATRQELLNTQSSMVPLPSIDEKDAEDENDNDDGDGDVRQLSRGFRSSRQAYPRTEALQQELHVVAEAAAVNSGRLYFGLPMRPTSSVPISTCFL